MLHLVPFESKNAPYLTLSHRSILNKLTPEIILNKLTPEMFESLFQQLLTAGINTPEILQEVILLIFTKAVDEPTFCPMYAALCEKLSRALPEFPPSNGAGGGGEEGSGAGGGEPISFRRVLLGTCQEEFERAAKQRLQEEFERAAKLRLQWLEEPVVLGACQEEFERAAKRRRLQMGGWDQ
ncbi:unnamed protein product [Closterium sp. Yama58-4]|nr:unnamed protein product [Closterium sp. Yama58-4]